MRSVRVELVWFGAQLDRHGRPWSPPVLSCFASHRLPLAVTSLRRKEGAKVRLWARRHGDAPVASVDDPYAMAMDTSHAGHDLQTVRAWVVEKLRGAQPFMLPQTRPFIVVPCQTFEDALRVAYRFSKASFARERPWRSNTQGRRGHRMRRRHSDTA